MDVEKSCANCKHSRNLNFFKERVVWDCNETPAIVKSFSGIIEKDFKTFSCSEYVSIFEKKEDGR